MRRLIGAFDVYIYAKTGFLMTRLVKWLGSFHYSMLRAMRLGEECLNILIETVHFLYFFDLMDVTLAIFFIYDQIIMANKISYEPRHKTASASCVN